MHAALLVYEWVIVSFLALLELCTLEGLKYERANLTLRQLHAISSSAKHDMNNKSFNIQGHMDSVKICILFQEVDSLVPAFWKHIPFTQMQDKYASSVLRYWSLFLTYVVMFISLTPSFYMHIKHMAAICIKFWDFPPLPLYICFGESPQCCLLVLLCVFTTMPGVLDLQPEHEFSMKCVHISNHLCVHLCIK